MKFSVAAIIYSNNKYLFQKRDNKKNIFYPGYCSLFGGQNNKYEKPFNSIKRELLEEINLDFKTINYFMTVNLQSKVFKKKNSSIFNRYIYICKLPNNYKKNIKALEGKGFILENISKLNKLKIAPFDLAITKFYHLLRNKRQIIPKKFLISNYKKIV